MGWGGGRNLKRKIRFEGSLARNFFFGSFPLGERQGKASRLKLERCLDATR